ncbi:MAG: ABC transporter ATP-binding protein [Chloroflexi bacterium]|nr:MAG: ABC transporter ATP-binding protein [Chloroflexota bacterium]MBL1193810.1 ABC transporter ATP-binding protein [Chloroflexota bacterium]NOH11103.1 ABC transporter ATP-binding protein [Chloroflexota bacterium]
MASVEFKNVCKKYGDVEAVVEANWLCEDREFFSILGPSGCGKSSSLRMIAGLEEITAGEIRFDDEIVNHLAPRDRNIAMVFENWALYPNMTVFDNIAFPLQVRELPSSEVDKKVRRAMQFLNLEHLENSGVRGLSGGEKQRIAIGRAIVRDPSVLIMDEPISHLDAGLRSRMRDELKSQVSELGVTTLYITHDQVESMAMADRIAIMNLGRIQQVGTPLDIYHNPRNEFVAGFIGEPPMNFADCELVAENGKFLAKSSSFEIAITGENEQALKDYKGTTKLRLGVRPESTMLVPQSGAGTVSAVVDFVEHQGDRSFVTVKLSNGEIFLVEAESGVELEINENVNVKLEEEYTHYFDAENGLNILFLDEEHD